MILARPYSRKIISALVVYVIVLSLAWAAPAAAASKSRKGASRNAKQSSKQKKGTRSARGGSKASRSKGRLARGSRGRRGDKRIAGRGRRSRWQRRVVISSTPSYNHSGVHDYLTEAWSHAHSSPPIERPVGIAVRPSAADPAYSTVPRAGTGMDVAAPQRSSSDQSLAEPIENPLVLAYMESLNDRGHSADNQGFILSTMDGQVLAAHNADRPFNPASVVKMATSLVAISRLGPDFRFRTTLYTDGSLDPATGVLHGSLYVIGSGDPAFFYENALLIADKLNRSGIRVVEGDLVVLGPFYFNFSAAREMSAKGFRTTLTPETWTAAARTAYPRFLSMRMAEERQGGGLVPVAPPSLTIMGRTLTNEVVNTSSLRILAVHTSLPLVRLLKGLNDFSNNWMASAIGNLVGGPDAVQRFLKTDVGLRDEELSIVTASGLGSNYISPRATVQILRKLLAYLDKEHLHIEELLPVAGVDGGTLGRRFNDSFRGSVVAKTGTLSGVSALAGVAFTRGKGPLLFVIYNRGGSSSSFRSVQDETIKKVITFFGGPAPVRYMPNSEPAISDRMPEAGARLPSVASPR